MKALVLAVTIGAPLLGAPAGAATLRAGAAAVDVSPPKLPVIVNGGFLEARSDRIHDRLHARALVLDDGATRLAIVVVDTCMMPRELIDRAKAIAAERTGIPSGRMLVSATHTHSAPSAMGALGSRPDPDYVAFLPGKIAEAIARAAANLEPAQAGWAVVADPEHTHTRRWIRRPDRMLRDPFDDLTVRANMHPGHESPDVIGPSGPSDPGLSVLAVRSPAGRPIAVLANYSMHYFGTAAVSSDYYGRFCDAIARLIGAEAGGERPFVAMMSQGTSGDQQWMDYGRPRPAITIDHYAEAVAAKAHEAYRAIRYRDDVPLAMAETRLTLRRRVPDAARLAWARPIAAAVGDGVPKSQAEVYAKEAIYLHEEPERELILQAIRVGDLGIAAIPDEVYALTGLKLKAMSPLEPTFTIELANGSEGYIPPPEQHALGGYTTWPARTAGLEVQAEPRIVEATLGLLEQVSGRPRRMPREPNGPYAEAVLAARPRAYWRLADMAGREATEATGRGPTARMEGGVALYLDGPAAPGFSGPAASNRAVHLAGGRLVAALPGLGPRHAVALWFWNGLPGDARAVAGELVALGDGGDILGIGGTATTPGRLQFHSRPGDEAPLMGTTGIAPRTWHHVLLLRDGEGVTVYLDGRPEITGKAPAARPEGAERLYIGGGPDPGRRFEGKVDEVVVFDRVLAPAEVATMAGGDPGPAR
jgi:hypothetical protein